MDCCSTHSLRPTCCCADDIYREDITFRDPRNHFTGIKNYKTIFWSLRFHGTLFFSHLHVDISRLWQPDEQTLRYAFLAPALRLLYLLLAVTVLA